MKRPTVFISYCHEDNQFVDGFANRLKASGVDVWIDKWMIKVGDSITGRIEEGIGASDWLILVLSQASVASKWVREELNAALIRNIEQEKHAYILPVLIEECKIPNLLEHRRYANFKDSREQAFQELLEVIRPGARFEPELILIPAGEFLMGSDPEKDNDATEREQPQHTVYLPDYHIAKTPVTNAQYAAFVQATLHNQPSHWPKILEVPPGKENHPVVEVSWHDAVAYCNWLAEATGKAYRLPSEAEWEKAARGRDGRIWPWGDEPPDENRCNFDNKVRTTTPVGQYSPGGDSPYGCVDMAGNVWEWVQSEYQPYPYQVDDGRENLDSTNVRVLRGGSWFSSGEGVRAAYRYGTPPGGRPDDIGFRCVVEPGN